MPSNIKEYVKFVIKTENMIIRLTHAKKMVIFNMFTSLIPVPLEMLQSYQENSLVTLLR